jgi:hypothetical protein
VRVRQERVPQPREQRRTLVVVLVVMLGRGHAPMIPARAIARRVGDLRPRADRELACSPRSPGRREPGAVPLPFGW